MKTTQNFFFTLTLAFSLFVSNAAMADCWMQCVATVPFTGKCVAKTKLCNISDADNALASLQGDIGAAYSNLKDEWVHIYGQLPEQLRTALEKYPLTIAIAIFPGTREYALLMAGIESYTARAKSRSLQLAPLVQTAPDWKADLAHDGEAVVLIFEGIELGNVDWTQSPETYIPNKFDGAWNSFVSCLEGASDLSAGNGCLSQLKRNIAVL